MLVSSFFHIPSLIALGVIALILILSIIASIIWPKPPESPPIEIADESEKVKELVTAGSDKEKISKE